MTDPNVAPPLFGSAHPELSASAQAAVNARGNPVSLNLDDIFGDVVFTPDGDTVFLSEQTDDGEVLNSGEGDHVASMASRPSSDGIYHPVQRAGGIQTTQLDEHGKPALAMGAMTAGVKSSGDVPFRHNPQAGHQLQYAVPKKKSNRSERKMSEQQKVERR